MNSDIKLLARLCKSTTNEAIKWIRDHPNDKSADITSKVKKIYYGYGGRGAGNSEYNIEIKSDGIYICNGEGAETNKYTYSAIVRELMELMDYMKSTENNEHSEEDTPKANEPADGIECLELDIRTYNSLKNAGINKIFEIREKSDELSKALGKKFNDVLEAVANYNSKQESNKTLSGLKKHLDDAIVPCPFWNAELCGIVGNRKKSIAFRCEALHSVDVYDFIDADRIISECCNYTECADYYRQQLKHITTPPNEAWNMHTSVAELRRLCETYGSHDAIKNVVDSVMASDNAPAPTSKEETAIFDYSELDADTAAKLESVTAEIFNVRKDYIFTMAKKVAYAHDLLANHYGGKFGAWCESIGISRDTGNNLVRVAEIFGNLTADEYKNLSQIKPSLLYEASKPSAPPELVEQVKSGDITTHKEYIALKKELERTKDELRQADANSAAKDKEYQRELEEANKKVELAQFHEKQAQESYKRISDASSKNYEKYQEERRKNADLQEQIKQLKKRPVDVATVDNTEELAAKDAEISKLQQRLKENAEDVDMIRNTFMELCMYARTAFKACARFITNNNYSDATLAKLKCDAEGTIDTILDIINDIRGVTDEEDI